MSTRTKTILAAPDGVTESQIEGTYYWPEEDEKGRFVVSTTNPGHVKVLRQHGYELVGEIAIMAPAAAKGPIDVEELGKNGIMAALTERGVSYPPEATRAELADIADAWNSARRRGRLDGAAAPRASEAEIRAADAGQGRAATQASETRTKPAGDAERRPSDGVSGEVNFGDASYDELKGWLTARGIAYPPNTPKKTLREMAEAAHAELVRPKGEAAA